MKSIMVHPMLLTSYDQYSSSVRWLTNNT